MRSPCLTCRALGPWGRSGRCDKCRKAKVRQYESAPARSAYKAARYDANHRAARKRWEPIAQGYPCARCGEPIHGPWHLDHIDGGSAPSHQRCNVIATSQNGVS